MLRNEFGFEGIVITDWIISGYETEKGGIYPVSDASHVCMSGGDLYMLGSQHDFDIINDGLKKGTVSRKQLMINASRLMKMSEKLVKS